MRDLSCRIAYVWGCDSLANRSGSSRVFASLSFYAASRLHQICTACLFPERHILGIFWTVARQQSRVHNRYFNLSTTETKRDQNLLLQLACALIRFLPVFQMQFALVEVEIARIKHRAQHFVGNIVSNAVAQQSLNHFPLSSWYIWIPSCACASLHYISSRRHWSYGNLGHSVKSVFQNSDISRGFVIFLAVFLIEVRIMWKLFSIPQ